MTEIGEQIKKLRESKGYSQAEFANKLGIGRGTLVKMEAGMQRVYWDVIVSIATYCDISLDELAGRKTRIDNTQQVDIKELDDLIEKIQMMEDDGERNVLFQQLRVIFKRMKSEITTLKTELLDSLRTLKKLV